MKKSFFVKALLFLCIAVCGAVCSYAAVLYSGMDLLLAGVVLTIALESVVTVNLGCKWWGFFLHLLWAGMFLALMCQYQLPTVDVGWQWYFLWGLLALRLLLLQPIYLKLLSDKPKNYEHNVLH